MLSDRHSPDEGCYASFIQCVGAASSKNDANVLSDKFVAEKVREIRVNEFSLSDISASEGIFATQRDLDNFIGEWTYFGTQGLVAAHISDENDSFWPKLP